MPGELPPQAQGDARNTEVAEVSVVPEALAALANPPLKAGVAVSVRDGPFAGMHGVVCNCDESRRRVMMTVEALHRPVILEIDRPLLDVLPSPDATNLKGLTMPPQKMTPPINPHRPATLAAAAAQPDRPADHADDHDAPSELSKRVRAIIVRRAKVAGLSDVAYFHEIIAGRAPRITRQEASGETTP